MDGAHVAAHCSSCKQGLIAFAELPDDKRGNREDFAW
jgi:hypothetical protein